MTQDDLNVTVRFIGASAEGAVVRFDELFQFFASVYKALEQVERCVSPDAKKLVYQVVGLEMGSAVATVAPARPKRGPDYRQDVVKTFRETCRALQARSKRLDPRIDRDALEAFRSVGKPLRKGTKADEKRAIQIDGLPLTTDFLATIDKALEEIDISYGSVSGVLERVNLHDKSEFVIYPNLDEYAITCSFDESLLDFETIRAAIRRTVTVSGRMHYSKTRPFPIRVDVEADGLEIHPPSDELPTLTALSGMLRQQGTDSVALVRAIRDQYE